MESDCDLLRDFCRRGRLASLVAKSGKQIFVAWDGQANGGRLRLCRRLCAIGGTLLVCIARESVTASVRAPKQFSHAM